MDPSAHGGPAIIPSADAASSRPAPVARTVAAVVVLAALLVLVVRAVDLGTVPIDGSYYLAKARSLWETGRLRVPWGTGVDTKFFPGLSILFAAPTGILGWPWGWIAVEGSALVACALLTATLARRLGASARAAATAAAAFAVDPLVLKWGSVPYAELPALAFTLAAVEFAARARESNRRAVNEVAAALALGVAGTMRLEAFLALPALWFAATSGRRLWGAVRAGVAITAIASLPIAAHLSVMASLGTGPSRLEYVREFVRNFDIDKYRANVAAFFGDLLRITAPKSEVASAMGDRLGAAYAVARYTATALTLVGFVRLLRGCGRGPVVCAIALLVSYPLLHGLWHYSDARFLLLVWPVVAIALGAGLDAVTVLARDAAGAPRWNGAVALVLGIALATIALLAANRTALAHARSWDGAAGGSAVELARRLATLVPEDSEGLYEIGGPMIAMHRRAPARFAYAIPNFFEPDVAPEAIPAILQSGNRFVVTNLPLLPWLAQRGVPFHRRGEFRALIEEPGCSVIVAAR